MSSKISFTIRRPSPESRATSSGPDSDFQSFKVPSLPRRLINDSAPGSPLARSANASPKHNSRTYDERDSSDEDEDGVNDELVTGFDHFGVQRLHEKKKPQGPLILPSLKNRDWRELARKRKTINRYVPASAKAETGADGSVGGLGTKDTINSGPQLSGIQIKQKKVRTEMAGVEFEQKGVTEDVKSEEEETEDQKAIRALLAGTDGVDDGPMIDFIPQPVSETDAYRQDIEEFPDEASLDDYARVPVAQFGAALLRGMGWKEGTAASKNKRGIVEPWVPTARPALLGIGAKQQEVFDDGSSKLKKGGKKGPERRYVPLVKKERMSDTNDNRESSGSTSGSRSRRHSPPRRDSAPTSRRGSRSPSPGRRRHQDDRRPEGGDRDRDRDSHRSSYRDHDYDRAGYRDHDKDRRDKRDH